ncbi:MAG: VWA domain-containing protein [Bdellovibrionales bacterium]|nr:VWA domain-containing protein [Bdellovibrionales bacterium]
MGRLAQDTGRSGGAWTRGIALAGLAWALAMSGCKDSRSLVLIVDTSGSMRRDSLLDEVKTSMKKILKDYGPGDRVFLVSFDAESQVVLDRTIADPAKDLSELHTAIDGLEAKGRWTDLVHALDTSLTHVSRLRQEGRADRTTMVLYTDGRHDPPPTRKSIAGQGAFDQLLVKYYSDYRQGDSWFIFYVELDEPEPGLKEFLSKTGSGVVVGREALRSEESFARLPVNWTLPAVAAMLGLFLLGIWFLLIAPRLRGVSLVPAQGGLDPSRAPNQIRLDSFRKGSFRRLLGLGSASDIEITVGGSRVDVSVDPKGRYFLDVPKGAGVKVDGAPVTGKTEIRVGQKLEFGRSGYVFARDRKK